MFFISAHLPFQMLNQSSKRNHRYQYEYTKYTNVLFGATRSIVAMKSCIIKDKKTKRTQCADESETFKEAIVKQKVLGRRNCIGFIINKFSVRK